MAITGNIGRVFVVIRLMSSTKKRLSCSTLEAAPLRARFALWLRWITDAFDSCCRGSWICETNYASKEAI
jgi:hypothetical protein